MRWFRFLAYLLIALFLMSVATYYILRDHINIGTFYAVSGAVRKFKFHDFFSNTPSRENQQCVLPDQQLWPNKKFREMYADVSKPNCSKSGRDWVTVELGVFRILEHAKAKYGKITCDYVPIIWRDDSHSYEGERVRDVTDGANVTDDVIKVTCHAGINETYTNLHITVPYVEALQGRIESVPLPKDALGMNVLMFGFDSLSRMTWMRKLPKTYAYMMRVLKPTVLEGYNIMGDGTTAALLPILTGSKEDELTLGYFSAFRQPVDSLPFIWDDFKRAGYVTSYTEECAKYNTFSLRMNGFTKPPTDHYIKRFFALLDKIDKSTHNCLGSRTQHKVLLNYMKEFEIRYRTKRRFHFGFTVSIPHGNPARTNILDDETREWLEDLFTRGLLNNTLLVLMADHGSRFSAARESLQGTIEERNPFFSVRVPDWFKTTHPKAYKNLVKNSKRLTTPLDIHATFHDLLNFQGDKSRVGGKTRKRGLSLFSEIPVERTCADAAIGSHWCNCLVWKTVANDSENVRKAADCSVDLLNSLTKQLRDKCSVLSLDRLVNAKLMTPHPTLKKDTHTEFYQLSLHTKPGGGHFEITVTHNVATGKFTCNRSGVSRTNAYGQDAACMSQGQARLAPFCYCKKKGA